ncbi:unnamed protein product [Didymodactylos carnosus]|uniref:Uncharacterized protein n=1 Tax=Didymodactylos carnosus TaxID=1234261 RepID=A0A814U103_9BILA|nr:unnamed protein product [Didymodactylos carnosus]CAF3930982.1 unnamed protein product [Didymodactylos carnosus]
MATFLCRVKAFDEERQGCHTSTTDVLSQPFSDNQTHVELPLGHEHFYRLYADGVQKYQCLYNDVTEQYNWEMDHP